MTAMDMALRTPKDVGAAIRARRRSLGWDQAELARRIGVSRLWVGQVEAGKPGAGLGLVLRALDALELTLAIPTPGDPGAATEPSAPVRTVDLDAIVQAARGKPSP
jgi:HTH-type transcriptional regulator/antitoxin HipB